MDHSYVNTHIDTHRFIPHSPDYSQVLVACRSQKWTFRSSGEKKKNSPCDKMLKCIADLSPKTLPQSARTPWATSPLKDSVKAECT